MLFQIARYGKKLKNQDSGHFQFAYISETMRLREKLQTKSDPNDEI
jgi:hypothetical protein